MSKHCEHCTDSCDLYFDVSERLHTSGNAAWASGHCPYCNADMGKFIPHGERCGSMVEHPNLLKPAPWCPDCNAAQYRDQFGDDVNTMGYRDGPDDPALVERAAIVAWLRVQPFLIKWPWAAAAGIERGEHLRGNDE